MAQFALPDLAHEAPLRILLIDAGGDASLSWAGLAQPLRLAARVLGRERLQVQTAPLPAAADAGFAHIALLVADVDTDSPAAEELRRAIERCQQAPAWGGVGAAVLWLARAGALEGTRAALPWSLYAETDDTAERAILSSQIFEIDGNRLTCCGGAASIDFSLTLLQEVFGSDLQAVVKEALCIDRVRPGGERQRVALQARFGALQPKLSEAVMLMEANIEEPLSTDEIAGLVGISRRQLERQFKQYLGSVPSRYYLELRLRRARQLLLESNQSIVQVGLMCGFSSGSHFSTAYGTLFGITPREERQRKMQA